MTKQLTPEKSVEWFDALKALSHEELKNFGLGMWDTGHYLYPLEWYDFIPDGYEVVDIFGDREAFKHGETDTDTRFGVLAFGFTTSDYKAQEARHE